MTTSARKGIHVLHVLPSPCVAGGEIATRRIAEAVRPHGIESSALLLSPTPELRDFFESGGLRCFSSNALPEPSIRRASEFLRRSRALAASRLQADLLHCADVPAAYRIAVAGRLAGIPVLTHVRNRMPEISLRNQIFVRATTHYAFVSHDTRAKFAFRVKDRRASVVYDGIDVAPDEELAARDVTAGRLRRELGLRENTILVAMFARVAPQKDFETLIRSAAMLRDKFPSLMFLLVGDNSSNPDFRRHYELVKAWIAHAALKDRFLFCGFRQDVRRFMLAADLCVLSTHTEGLPLALVETLSMGRPCVATAVDGILEIVTHGVSGFLVPPKDPEALATAIADALSDRAMARRLGLQGRLDVKRRFSRERFAADMVALYRRLAGRAELQMSARHGEAQTDDCRVA